MEECLYCQDPFQPTRDGQQFCVGKGCRQAWHRENSIGYVTRIFKRSDGQYTVTSVIPHPPAFSKGADVVISCVQTQSEAI